MNALIQTRADTTHIDVIVVGAGISGIGSAVHLGQQCPDKSWLILEMKDSFGGTWDTHKYPGTRSDSDLYTFGYRFKPWVGAPIASRAEILKYLGEVIEENGLAPNIRYGHRITAAAWDSKAALWTLEVTTGDGATQVFTTGFLWMCQGYYDHEVPYLPEWAGMKDFAGALVHAQLWDPATEYTGKRVVVIGSGATAATVIPAMAGDAAHVTMLQRSPTYFFCAPNVNELADRLRQIGIDEPTIHRVVRQQVMHDQNQLTLRCQAEPDAVFEELKELARGYAGADFDFSEHFTPRYRIWQQRLAFVPDGDLFGAIAAGKVDVITDEIERFTAGGIVTKGGQTIPADLVVAATGFNLKVMGGIPFTVDGRAIDWGRTTTFRGMMMTGVPNLAWVMGYFRASWTLRVDMMGDFICNLLNHMDAIEARQVEVAVPEALAGMPALPWIEEDNFNPGYLMRGLDQMPKRGDRPEWRHNQDYWSEKDAFPLIDLAGPEFVYDGVQAIAQSEPVAA